MPPPRRKNPFAKAVLAPRIPPPEQPLTQIQLKVLDAIKTLTDEKGYCPTVREIMRAVGLQSSSSAGYQVKRLKELGWVTYDSKVPRSIRLVLPSSLPPGGDAA